jgi:acyl-[acyl-carrier-protein]-phospholipid O-acyltransferase / long-chain-fatty-acid--[acyl-carrier-protein] ligase
MLRIICQILVSLFARWRVVGAVPTRPPQKLIVIANHQSFVDAVMLGLALPWEPTWIVHTTIAAQWHFRMVLKHVPHLVVDVTRPWR